MKRPLILALLFGPLLLHAQTDEANIRKSLNEIVAGYGLEAEDASEYFVSGNYTQKSTGNTHVYLTQTAHGHEIFNAILQLHFSADGKLAASNSRFVPQKTGKTNASAPALSPEQALAAALKTVNLSPGTEFVFESTEHPDRFLLKNPALLHNPVRATLGYENTGNGLRLVYRFIIEPKKSADMFNVRIDALTGETVAMHNRILSCDAASVSADSHAHAEHATHALAAPLAGAVYNAYPLGLESPLNGGRQLLTGVESPQASPFGWHDVNGLTGAEYTITRGNNVFTYEDENDTDMPGYSPDGGGTLNFDYPLNFALTPQQNMDAALTNLFVWNNFMHDVSYRYGFDEESGNFQANNYNRGGQQDDEVHAQGFDGSGTNNANFGTPEDGYNPRMQMFLWQHRRGNLLTVNSPAGLAGSFSCTAALFGPYPPNPGSITADVVLMRSSGGSTEGCSPATNAAALNGKIALIDRGTCPFVDKAQNAQQAGAVAVIVVNNVSGPAMALTGDDFGQLTIPSIGITREDGDLIKAALANGVNASVGGLVNSLVYDCNFDNGVISHEYGHGISTRLTGGPSSVDCLRNDEQAGEGWSDFFALVMTEAPGSSVNDVRAIGNYPSGQTSSGIGIRTYPYSHDMTVNPFTYRSVGSQVIPHGVGSVWCTMIWDLYWDMVALYPHSHDLYATDGGNNKAIRLVMEGLRLQPCSPGFVDARNAILQADQLLYGGIHYCLIWKTFARRGLGFSASQGSSGTVGDETEAFDLPPGCSGSDISFSASSRAICEQQTVTFQNLVSPQATSVSWSFPGGVPTTSTDPSPTVSYATAGTYPVTLSAVNVNGNQTYTEQAYIDVSLPITFSVATVPYVQNTALGRAQVTVTGGTGPFRYSWDGAPPVSNNLHTLLNPGTHTVTVTNTRGCSATQTFIILDVTGVTESETTDFTVYPNPTEATVYLTAGKAITSVRVTDISGKELSNKNVNSLNTEISLEGWASGVYLLHVSIGEHTYVRKVMKK